MLFPPLKEVTHINGIPMHVANDRTETKTSQDHSVIEVLVLASIKWVVVYYCF